MTKRPRRNHSPAIKPKVGLAAVRGEKTMAELAQQFDVHPNQSTQWRSQLLECAAGVFGPEQSAATAVLAIDVKTLHVDIGELTLANDPLQSQGSLLRWKARSTRPDCCRAQDDDRPLA